MTQARRGWTVAPDAVGLEWHGSLPVSFPRRRESSLIPTRGCGNGRRKWIPVSAGMTKSRRVRLDAPILYVVIRRRWTHRPMAERPGRRTAITCSGGSPSTIFKTTASRSGTCPCPAQRTPRPVRRLRMIVLRNTHAARGPRRVTHCRSRDADRRQRRRGRVQPSRIPHHCPCPSWGTVPAAEKVKGRL